MTGRQGARQSFWDATFSATREKQPASLATARRPEPLYVFGAAGAASDNRKTEPRDALNASSLTQLTNARCARYLLPEVQKKPRKLGLRLLTIGAIYGFGLLCQPHVKRR